MLKRSWVVAEDGAIVGVKSCIGWVIVWKVIKVGVSEERIEGWALDAALKDAAVNRNVEYLCVCAWIDYSRGMVRNDGFKESA